MSQTQEMRSARQRSLFEKQRIEKEISDAAEHKRKISEQLGIEERQREQERQKNDARQRAERQMMEEEDRRAWAQLNLKSVTETEAVVWEEGSSLHTVAQLTVRNSHSQSRSSHVVRLLNPNFVLSLLCIVHLLRYFFQFLKCPRLPQDKFVMDMSELGFDVELLRLAFHHYGMDRQKVYLLSLFFNLPIALGKPICYASGRPSTARL